MTVFKTMTAAALVLLLSAGAAVAQSKTIQGKTVTATGTIEAIESSTRMLTIKNNEGLYEMLRVPADVVRFDALKVGDKISVRYYDNVVLRLKKPGQAAVDVTSGGVTPTPGQKPGGTAAAQETVTVTVTAIDSKVPSITVKDPKGRVFSRKVEDTKALAQVKVGDQIDITWTEALLISVEPPK